MLPAPTFDQIRHYIVKWVGQAVDAVVKQAFQGYYSKQLSEIEARVYVSNNLLLNFSELLRGLNEQHLALWKLHWKKLVENFEKYIIRSLSYLEVHYPQKGKTFVSDEVNSLLKVMDDTKRREFSLLKRLDINFNPCSGVSRKEEASVVFSGDYSHKIKLLVNKLISLAQKYFPPFRKFLDNVFAVDEDKKVLPYLSGMKFKENTP